jgi:hypothetical protein
MIRQKQTNEIHTHTYIPTHTHIPTHIPTHTYTHIHTQKTHTHTRARANTHSLRERNRDRLLKNVLDHVPIVAFLFYYSFTRNLLLTSEL